MDKTKRRKRSSTPNQRRTPFLKVLRDWGFMLEFRDRSGGTICMQYTLNNGERTLKVQLWGMGQHSVSHGTNTPLGCHETTDPTGFQTVDGMINAIKYEWVRPLGVNSNIGAYKSPRLPTPPRRPLRLETTRLVKWPGRDCMCPMVTTCRAVGRCRIQDMEKARKAVK